MREMDTIIKTVAELHAGRAGDGTFFDTMQWIEAGNWLANDFGLMQRLDAMSADEREKTALAILKRVTTIPGVLRHNWYMCSYGDDGADVMASSIWELMHIWTRVDGAPSVSRWLKRHTRPITLELGFMTILSQPIYGMDLLLHMAKPNNPILRLKGLVEVARKDLGNVDRTKMASILLAGVIEEDMYSGGTGKLSHKDAINGIIKTAHSMAVVDEREPLSTNQVGQTTWGEIGKSEHEYVSAADPLQPLSQALLDHIIEQVLVGAKLDMVEVLYHDEVPSDLYHVPASLERVAIDLALTR